MHALIDAMRLNSHTPSQEVNFDGLVGPSHNYAGLSYGNQASMRSRAAVSDPQAAALQGLVKMRVVAGHGIRQAVLPPLHRPAVAALRRLGFTGSRTQVLEKAHRTAPELLLACYSASSMWSANAVTTTPSLDAQDGRLHITPANLVTNFHRSLEPEETASVWRAIFADQERFVHHASLPANLVLSDEGAANHTRLAVRHHQSGIHLFVYGRRGFSALIDGRFPRRQTLEASQAITRLHTLDCARTVYAQQHPAAIDAGAFHNDVIATGNERVLLFHRFAFTETDRILGELTRAYANVSKGEPLYLREIAEFTLEDAVRSYFFNSQLLTLPGGDMLLLAPEECRSNPAVADTIAGLISDPACPVSQAQFINLRESMRNGGGPACLRNRVLLSEMEQARLTGQVFFNAVLDEALTAWVKKHYRTALSGDDLRDPQLPVEIDTALDQLTQILQLGSIYPFQQIAA
ncbi:MAG: N-succinylarginine dihydrolase [Verrucomicrobia bacterium]|nr:N-succinylarginine dihydrolase [Verrucomicrobiota bacterium]